MYLPGPVDKVSSINSRSAHTHLDHLMLMSYLDVRRCLKMIIKHKHVDDVTEGSPYKRVVTCQSLRQFLDTRIFLIGGAAVRRTKRFHFQWKQNTSGRSHETKSLCYFLKVKKTVHVTEMHGACGELNNVKIASLAGYCLCCIN